MKGSEKAPVKMDMRPRSQGVSTDPATAAAIAAKKKKAFAPLKSSKELQRDVRYTYNYIKLRLEWLLGLALAGCLLALEAGSRRRCTARISRSRRQ